MEIKPFEATVKLKEIIVSSFSDVEKEIWGDNKLSSKEYKATVFQKFIINDNIPVAYVACTDSGKLGLAKGDVNLSIAVHNSFRRKGLAKLLIRQAVNWFITTDYDTMSFIMDERNIASKRLAQSSGFVFMEYWQEKKEYFYMITNFNLYLHELQCPACGTKLLYI